MDEVRVLRDRHSALLAAFDRATGGSPNCAAAMCVVTFAVATYPTAAGQFYACHPQLLTGDETEGAAPSFQPDTNTTLYALNLGTAIPPIGTKLVVHNVGGRWCFRYNG